MSKVLVKRGRGRINATENKNWPKITKHSAVQSPGPVPEIHCGHHWVTETLRNWELRCMDGKGEPEVISKIRHFQKQSDCLHTYKGEYIYHGEFCPLNKAKFPNLKRIFSNSEIHFKERHRRKMRKRWFKLILPRNGSEGTSENRQNENKSQKMGIKGSNEFKLQSCSGTEKDRQEAQTSWWQEKMNRFLTNIQKEMQKESPALLHCTSHGWAQRWGSALGLTHPRPQSWCRSLAPAGSLGYHWESEEEVGTRGTKADPSQPLSRCSFGLSPSLRPHP